MGRRSKAQRRIDFILARLPATREQLIVALEELGDPSPDRLAASSTSPDARERNRVKALERNYEELVNWMDELAARGLAEALRLGAIEKGTGTPFERLAHTGAIPARSAETLARLRRVRDEVQHAYPWEDAAALHDGVRTLLEELDRFVDRYERWLRQVGIRGD